MIVTLRETTKKNAEQGWLDSNLARIGGLLQGQRDLGEVCRMIMDEVTPLVDAQLGAFFLADAGRPTGRSVPAAADAPSLRRTWRRGQRRQRSGPARAWSGRPPLSRRAIRVSAAAGQPATCDPLRAGRDARRPTWSCCRCCSRASCSASSSSPAVGPFSELHLAFLERLVVTIGVALNTIQANRRTEELLAQSQRPGPRAAGPVGRAAAHQRRAGGEGGAAVRAERQHRDQEPGDRAGPARPGGEGAAAGAGRRSTSRSSWPT